jgi:hypothetical protein
VVTLYKFYRLGLDSRGHVRIILSIFLKYEGVQRMYPFIELLTMYGL